MRKLEEALKQNNKRYDTKIYPDAKHAFHREGPNYHDFVYALFDAWYNDGGSYVVVEYNGDVYLYDFFVEGQRLLGNSGSTGILPLHAGAFFCSGGALCADAG